MTTLIASWFLFVLEGDANCLCQFTSLLPGTKLSSGEEAAIPAMCEPGGGGENPCAGGGGRLGVLISAPARHGALINLTDFSETELTVGRASPREHVSLSPSRSIILVL